MRDMNLRSEVAVSRSVPCRCPASGCRGAEMVAGRLDVFRDALHGTSFKSFMAAAHVTLPADAWDRLRQEWQRGASYIVENLTLWLEYFQSLPWVILGRCHHDQTVAKAQLQRAKDLWEQIPGEARDLQHRLCQQLFQPGELREQMLAFIGSSEPLSSFDLLEKSLAPLCFVQITERIIEAAHKELGSVSAQKSATQYSLCLHVPELLQLLETEADQFASLVASFVQARKLRNFGKLFAGHDNHPDILKLGLRAKTEKLISAICKILYRDPRVQHGDIAEAARVHHKANESLQKKARPFQPRAIQASQGAIFAEACTRFLRDIRDEDPSQVMSVSGKFFMPLILRPSAIHRPLHAPCTMRDRSKNEMIVSVLANTGPANAPVVSAMHDTSETQSLLLLPYVQDLGLDGFLQGVSVVVQSWQSFVGASRDTLGESSGGVAAADVPDRPILLRQLFRSSRSACSPRAL